MVFLPYMKKNVHVFMGVVKIGLRWLIAEDLSDAGRELVMYY